MALHFQQRGPHEQLEADHGGNGIPRQAEHGLSVQYAKGHRLARLHSHPPEAHVVAQPAQRGFHQIEITHRHAAARYQQIGGQPVVDVAREVFGVIAGDAQQNGFTAGLEHLSREGVGIGVEYLPHVGRIAQIDQFLSGRQDGHFWFLMHVHSRPADVRQHAERSRTQSGPLRKNGFARLHVLTRQADRFSFAHGEENMDLILGDSLGLLDEHDGVRSTSGMGAPVMILMASPGPTSRVAITPA